MGLLRSKSPKLTGQYSGCWFNLLTQLPALRDCLDLNLSWKYTTHTGMSFGTHYEFLCTSVNLMYETL